MKKYLLIAFLAVSSVFFLFRQDYTLSETIQEELRLYMGTNQTISVSNPTRIAIGNPAVADVSQVSKKEMTIVPKSTGATTLVLWDSFGEQSFMIKVFAENTKELKTRIDNALAKLHLSGISTKGEDEEGKIFMMGRLDNNQERDRITLALGGLKKYIIDLTTVKPAVEDETVVEIDVQVLELNKGVSDTLGFTWPASITLAETAVGGATNSWAKLFKLNEMARSAVYSLKLDMLIKEGKARVLSRPRLACLSGKEAKLLVGGEVPILSASVTGGGTGGTVATPGSVEYKEYGIKLNIKPTVKPNGRIYLNLGVEVSEVGTAVSTSFALAYPFTKRTANTELYLNDGQTMAIGGLIKQKTEEELTKFPWLADVPILGLFFRQKTATKGGGSTARSDSELFITLTPRIVGKAKDEIDRSNVRIKPAAPDVDEATLDPVTKYSRIVQQRIIDNIQYPAAGRNAGFQGIVKLNLKLSFKGELLEAKIKKSSGYKVLDEDALETAKSISPYYPLFPPAIASQDIWVEVPIVYQLD